MKKPEVAKFEYEAVVPEPVKDEVPPKVFGAKKPKVFVREKIEITETDPKKIDWLSLANQMTFLEFHELRKKLGLEE